MAVLIGLIACGNATGLLGFLYRHIFFFAYFRNLFFLGAFLIPIVILLGLYQLQMLLSIKPQDNSAKKMIIVGVIVLHALLFWFLKHFEGVPMVSYLTLGFSVVALAVYYSECFRFSSKDMDRDFCRSFGPSAGVDPSGLCFKCQGIRRCFAFHACHSRFSSGCGP